MGRSQFGPWLHSDVLNLQVAQKVAKLSPMHKECGRRLALLLPLLLAGPVRACYTAHSSSYG
jgi:hypothetical protein